ncbi:MAG: hypothetical protein L0Y71_02235 [Gemmataceae bacterium]|nr:hypothetical protein [Gemmataceae bacterium]
MQFRTILSLAVALIIPASVGGQSPKDPLRFVPSQAEVVVKMERPRALLEAVETHELVQEALKISGVRELYDSTNYRRLNQLIAYFEKELGKDKYELLDGLTGGGIVFAAKFSKPNAVMLAVQAKDEALLRRFAKMLHELAEKELARLEVKEPIRKTTYEGIDAYQFGPVRLALIDGAILLTNEDRVLKHLLHSHLGKEKLEPITQSASFREARKTIPATAHIWTWLDMEAVHQLPNYKTGFEAATQDPNLTILAGGLVDVIKRTPYVTAHVAQEKNDWRVRVHMPRGRNGMAPIAKMVLPQKDPGSLPLLKPPRTFASLSYFMDLGEFWKHKDKIFNEKQAKSLEAAEKQSAKFLAGVKLGTLFQQMGNHQRVVFTTPASSPYKTVPATKIPSFAVVLDMRDPQFGKSMNFILRGAALFGTFASKSGLKMVEEQHAGCNLVCYYFAENKPFEGDPNGVRFNFNPCFVIVGDQLVMSSTVELGKDLIDEIRRGSKDAPQPATMRTRLYATGAAQALRAGEEQVMTQLILNQALPPGAAREEVRRIIALVERLGMVGFEVNYGQNDYRFDVTWQTGTK